jgi:hypothetical protein
MGPKTVAQSFDVRVQIGPNEKSDRRRFRWQFRRRFRIQVTLGLAPCQPVVIRCQNDAGCGTQADNRILCEVGAEAATVQAKNPNGAENERDPVQDDARQMSQARPVHWRSVNAANPTSRWLTRRHQARTIVLHSLRFCPICARISLRRRATSGSFIMPTLAAVSKRN